LQSKTGIPRKPKLTAEEAAAMLKKGFGFSIYRPDSDGFQLSYPIQIAEDRVHGTLTFMQEGEEVAEAEAVEALPQDVEDYFTLKNAHAAD
jgi:hypothetical protein